MGISQIYNAQTRCPLYVEAGQYADRIDTSVDVNMEGKDTLGLENLTVNQTQSARYTARRKARRVAAQGGPKELTHGRAQITISDSISRLPEQQDPRDPRTDSLQAVSAHVQASSAKDYPSKDNAGSNQPRPSVPFRKMLPWRIDKLHRFNVIPKYHTRSIPPLGRPRTPQLSGPIATAISYDADRSPKRASGLQSGAFNVRSLHRSSPPERKRYHLRSREISKPQSGQSTTQVSASYTIEPSHNAKHSVVHAPKGRNPLPAPVPTAEYLRVAEVPPRLLARPQHLLLVLDLNGTLIYRQTASSNYLPRPSLKHFLDYCFANHSILVWSSATPPNVLAVCSKIFTPQQRQKILGEWARDTLDLTDAEYKAKTQVYKRLDRIWDSIALRGSHPQAANGGRWTQANTLLLDDSVIKAQAQPFSLVEIPEFTRPSQYGQREKGQEVLRQVMVYLEEARMFEDVSAFVREKRFTAEANFQKVEDDDMDDGGVRDV